ncbi:MAG: hypothetical protein M3198_06090 [Actinomycetota bacterium]|nr:hypothetical protein [Actinomycetota bacterium]
MTTLEGVWEYESFLILPSEAERAAPPGSPVTARKWAMGALTVSTDTDEEVSGELVFAPGITLNVRGLVLDTSSRLPILTATGEGVSGPTKGAVYRILGVIIRDANGQESVQGSVLAVRGPDVNPDVELGGMPINTVGSFVLSAEKKERGRTRS